MSNLENKVVKKKVVDKNLKLKVSKNEAGQRIFVEFSSADGKLLLQKSFQDTFEGRKAAEDFQNAFKSANDLYTYFGKTLKEK